MADDVKQSGGDDRGVEVTAWILPLDGWYRAAVGERELIHLIEKPVLLDVPCTPFYCHQVALWQGRILPVMDIAAWLTGQPIQRIRPWICVCVYQPTTTADLEYGALVLAEIPTREKVRDLQMCPLPDDPPGWAEIAVSCFADSIGAVPILDLPLIFSEALLTMQLEGLRAAL